MTGSAGHIFSKLVVVAVIPSAALLVVPFTNPIKRNDRQAMLDSISIVAVSQPRTSAPSFLRLLSFNMMPHSRQSLVSI